MNNNAIKLFGGLILWLCMVFFGMLPLRVKHFRTNETLLSMSNCFSGGLFIAIGLIHILPEAHGKLEGKDEAEAMEKGEEVFPVSYVICLATFSFILFIDRIMFANTDIAGIEDMHSIDLKRSIVKKPVEMYEEDHENFKEFVSSKFKVALKLSKYRRTKTDVLYCDDEERHRLHSPIHEVEEEGSYKSLHDHQLMLKQVSPEAEGLDKANADFVYSEDGASHVINETKPKASHHHLHDGHNHIHDHDAHGHHHHMMVSPGDNTLSAYILLMAMGIHGLFAGIAFGISDSNAETIDMFIAMASHKWSEALTVGVSFVSAEIPYEKGLYMIVFLSLITPLGIFIGYLLSGMSDTVIGIALAVSSGTFIYISCAEIIVEEFAIGVRKYWKFAAYTLGILFIAVVTMME